MTAPSERSRWSPSRSRVRWLSITSQVIVVVDVADHHVAMTIYADDLERGQEFDLGSHTVSEAEIVEFARRWDPVFIHADPVAARQGPLGGVVASGVHTLAIYQRLAVEALWSKFSGGVGRSFEVRFCRPVRPGTTLTGWAVVDSVAPRVGRGDAVVLIDAELSEETGPVVLQLRLDGVLPTRESEEATSSLH